MRRIGACLVVVAATALILVRTRSGRGPAAPGSTKIEVDAVTSATPRRLAAPLEITDVSTYEALHFDPDEREAGAFSYRLSKPAWVRVRLVARRDPDLLLRTLMDWSLRDLGENRGAWDGRDASGYLVDRRRVPCRLVIEGDDPHHAMHEPARCGDLALRITRPERAALIAGRVTVRIEVAGKKRGYGDRDYTLRTYVGGVRAGGCSYPPAAPGPFDWDWDATGLAPGVHMLTVNLDDGRDHVGTASVDVRVRE